MKKAVQRYLMIHGLLFCVLAAFSLYALLMRRLFPQGYFDCVTGDLLHLYCPLCGGTRALLSLLSLDVARAFSYNAGVLLLTGVLLLLDLRALCRLLAKKQERLLPRFAFPVILVALLFWMILRNALMLFGIDPTGDHAACWALPVWRAVLFVPLSLLLCTTGLLALWPSVRLVRMRPYLTLVAALSLVTLALLLWGQPLLCIAYLPILIGAGCYYMQKKRKEKSNEIPDLFRE